MKTKVIVFIAFIILVVGLLILRVLGDGKIRNNHVVVCGTITSIVVARGGLYIDYEYTVNGKLYKQNGSCTDTTNAKYERGINKILIVIDKDDPSLSELLEDWGDFDSYNISSKDTAGIICPN
jgi:hypothetical protein